MTLLWIIIAIVVIGLVWYFLIGKKKGPTLPKKPEGPTTPTPPPSEPTPPPPPPETPAT